MNDRYGNAQSKDKVKSSKLSSFQSKRTLSTIFERIYEVVRQIPSGSVASYGNIARCVGCGSAQAIGQAMRHNPYPIYKYNIPYPPEMVPCHRVVASSGSLGGFCGKKDPTSEELMRKISLLKQEGVIVTKEHRKIWHVRKVFFVDMQETVKEGNHGKKRPKRM
eukprot:gene1822-4921_t